MARGSHLPMLERYLFPSLVAVGVAGLLALGLHARSAPDRLHARATATGLASADLFIREMG